MKVEGRPQYELSIIRNIYGEINIGTTWISDEDDHHDVLLNQDDAVEVALKILDMVAQ